MGAAALAALAVIFLPMLFDDPVDPEDSIREPLIPPRPPELSGPQFAPLTEAEIRRGAELPPAQAKKTPPPPDDAVPARDPHPADASPVGRSVAPAAPNAPPAPDPSTRTVLAPPAKRPPDARRLAARDPAPAALRPGGQRVAKSTPASPGFAIQLGSFTRETNATALRDRLRKLGYNAYVDRIAGKTGSMFRVRVGPESERGKAEALRARIAKEARLRGLLVRYP